MKKEIFVIALLALMLAAAIVNVRFLGKLTDDVVKIAEKAANLATEGKWGEAETQAKAASKKWEDSETYTHIVLRHSEIERSTEVLNGLLREIYMREEGGVKGALAAAKSQMTSLASIERVRLGSIF